MNDINLPETTERRTPRRHVGLALLSARNEVLLIRRAQQVRYNLPAATIDRDADDDALTSAVTGLCTTLLAEGAPKPDSAWLGRFAAPDENGRLDMLEVYLARLGEARLRPDVDFERAWAPLLSPPPENMIDPAIELQVMPALALLIKPETQAAR
ncbi:hypothetical protein GCM10010082_20360 [Kushneria pakistanensis]|uniref:Nudix hydrolase domain-containing protein n=1 Tax=Kushneria pakistanensis TaxID=1508770 RepID=A0ABQ3FJV6_9GAMM|nr:hypothetical protein [Kushneria pakistanensis]GHC26996.1 hypothetical protein GCM10010082_20360 [Kushneria pakistanensis]